MKRFLIGCLGVFAVLLVAGGIAAYLFLVRPARQLINSVQQLRQIEQLDSRVQDRSVFTPPANGHLDQAQVDRYLLVQESIRTQLAGRVDQLEEKYDDFQTENGRPRIRQLVNAYSDLFGLIREAKEAQVEALNDQDFSLSEYAWVKDEVLSAAGYTMSGFSLAAIAEAASSGEELAPPTLAREVPQENLELLENYKDRLEEVIGLVFFGL